MMQTVACTEFGTFLGRRSERLLVRRKGEEDSEIPLFRISEIVVPARGVSLSGEIIEAACEGGIPITFVTSTGRPFALLSSPMLTATLRTRRRQLTAYREALGGELCRLIVAGKLRNQAGLSARSRDRLRQNTQRGARPVPRGPWTWLVPAAALERASNTAQRPSRDHSRRP